MKTLLSIAITLSTLYAQADVSVVFQRKDGFSEKTGKFLHAMIYPQQKKMYVSLTGKNSYYFINFDKITEAGLSNKEFVDMLKEASKTNKKTLSIYTNSEDTSNVDSVVSISFDER